MRLKQLDGRVSEYSCIQVQVDLNAIQIHKN